MTNQALLVENDVRQYDSLAAELQAADWKTHRAAYREEALKKIYELESTSLHLDAVAVDLGLPPNPDGISEGLTLVEDIRGQKRFMELPILAYTSQQVMPYASLVRRFLTMRVSFIYLRPMTEGAFAQVLKYVSLNYVMFSPAPAGYLPNAVPDKPDPLSDDLWETLESLNKGFIHQQVAEELHIAQETVRSRLDKARAILSERGEVEMEAHANEVLEWYRRHRVRYARDRTVEMNDRDVSK